MMPRDKDEIVTLVGHDANAPSALPETLEDDEDEFNLDTLEGLGFEIPDDECEHGQSSPQT